MAVIEVMNIVKDYGQNKGVFDLSFAIEKGEVFGFLGPNGAGKTTTIRQILGYIKSDSGSIKINNQEVWGNSYITNGSIGYLPGEINLPEKITGIEMIKFMAEIYGLKDLTKANELIERFELKLNDTDVHKMSKGMKQKLGIVCAFMHDPEILILDEPTSGLDPLMQQKFIDLVKEESEMGKTILMSSHMFDEIERTCTRVAFIRQGRIASFIDLNEFNNHSVRKYKITLQNIRQIQKLVAESSDFAKVNYSDEDETSIIVLVNDKDINKFISLISRYNIFKLTEVHQSLEDYFMKFYSIRDLEVK